MYNDEFNNNDMYRFTNREVPRDDYAPAPRQENTYTAPVRKQGFFHRTWVKVTALVLACAVVGGAAGYGGAALAKGGSGSGTAISESDRTVTAVEVKKVDGKTKMQPAEVYASTVNSTVSINCSSQSTNIFGQTTQSASSGSGFIISEDGYIVTNAHVIAGGQNALVALYNGDRYEAELVGFSSTEDLALLKAVNASGLPTAPLGDSEECQVGDTVYAIGNPLGVELRGTLTDGIVSAINRDVQVDGRTMTLVQTNAALNSGNSGGPLISDSGQVVGINFMKMYARYSTVEGLGFAIPSASIRRLVNDLLTYGEVRPEPSFGVTVLQTGTRLEDDIWGLQVLEVTPGSAADLAGIREGDFVLAAGGRPVETSQELLRIRRQLYVGDQVTMEIWRDGERMEVTLTLNDPVE